MKIALQIALLLFAALYFFRHRIRQEDGKQTLLLFLKG